MSKQHPVISEIYCVTLISNFSQHKMDDPFNVHWNVYKKRAGYQAMISEYLGKYLTEKYPNKSRVEFASILSVGHGEQFYPSGVGFVF